MIRKTLQLSKSRLFNKHSLRFNYAQEYVKPGKQKIVGGWLFVTATGILGMIVLGGYTRLTHSGLSMADWSPYTKKYPRSQQQWNVQFQKYKETVQFQTVNKQIGLQGFKPIYNVQFFHRQVGMWLGYIFVFPFATFTYQKMILPKLRNRLLAILAFGGLQGAIGWWMVKSGLKQKPEYQSRPRVSPYRLATHLMMATMLYSAVLWHSFKLLIKPLQVDPADINKLKYLRKVRIIGIVMIKFLMLNIFSGALVAGIDAGKVYNTWPLMNEKVIPETAFQQSPKWKNFFQNRALVQFNHRTMAYITESASVYLLYTIFKHRVPGPATVAALLAVLMVNYQAFSGIMTLLNLVPKQKANMHQMTAIITLSSLFLMVYLCKIPVLPPI